MLIIRRATPEDLPAITEIYNQAVLKTVATFDTEPRTLEDRKRWYDGHGDRYPILVADLDNIVVGRASLSRWSDRLAYSGTAEMSVYIKEEHGGQGIGRQLAARIVREGRDVGLHTLLARIAWGKEVSLHMAESVGFKHIGVMKEVGRKFGQLLDVHLMQLIYDDQRPCK